ncbi:ThiF family adenylyltransferase [uncultured Nocardioides sp.]|uniref:ThiF family adenylyltransferase n=1 Tax=uncultured Nocardioides sp. TaxID=198441 RepID=UPI00262D1FE7|nr:ThiF family adenylyltransferase [uncultured Nocardioides sp.]
MTRRQPPRPALSKWQRRALADLRAQAKHQPELLAVGAQNRDDDGNVLVRFTLHTDDLPAPSADGLHFKAVEEFVLLIGPTDDHPPTVLLEHGRFIGTPHVLSGFYLCLYLDESREWDPDAGVNGKNGVLNRLWDWMEKANQNDFNPDTALFHAVGGVPHLTPGTASIVVRHLPDPSARVVTAHLNRRTPKRLDLASQAQVDAEPTHVPVFFADSDMPLGAGHHFLGLLLGLIRHPRPHGLAHFIAAPRLTHTVRQPCASDLSIVASRDYTCPQWFAAHYPEPVPPPYETAPDAALFTALAASASRNPDGTPQRLILAVPHPAGGPRHLLALQLAPELADDLRRLVSHKTTTFIPYEPDRINMAAPIEWCFVSDERAAVTTRRDADRPVAALHGKTVAILGCGGIGSWIAEFVVRAGASHVVISDYGRVTGGLLVRQDYVEDDIGTAKVLALCDRLKATSDTVLVDAHGRLGTSELSQIALTADLIIDATISLKVSKQLDIITTNPQRKAFIAQVATDARSGTLGYATINPPGNTTSMTDMDHHLRDQVRADGALERYRYFWEEPAPGDEFVPTRGCSAPTFHGSAADLAALGGGLLTFIAKHLTIADRGAHLMALPHSDVTPGHRYVPYRPVAPGSAA